MSCVSQCGMRKFAKCRVLCFYIPLNSYGVVETVSSLNYNFQGKLDYAVNQYLVNMLLLVTDSIHESEEC